MNELLLYAGIAVAALLVALWIPGLKDIALMILKGLGSLTGVVLQHKGIFMVWLIKTLSQDHARIFRHMITSKAELDPTTKVRDKT